MTDFLLIARDEGLYNFITDDGAGGLLRPLARWPRIRTDGIVDLEKAPLKYHGLDPWEILLSEAQERMTMAVPPEKIDRFLELSRKMGVLSTVLRHVSPIRVSFHARFQGKTVAYLDMGFLHGGLPRMHLKASWERRYTTRRPPAEPADYAGGAR